MAHHVVPVSPGETIELVAFVAEVDEPDSAKSETFLFLDHVRWTCEDQGQPVTRWASEVAPSLPR